MSIRIITSDHWDTLTDLFENAGSEINIISPFITDGPVQLLVNALTENPGMRCNIITRFYREDFIQGVSRLSALRKLLDAGAELFALQTLHTKLYLIDGNNALLGSANFTSGGFSSNLELSLLIEDEVEVFAEIGKHFCELLAQIKAAGDFRITEDLIEKEEQQVTILRKGRLDPKTRVYNEHKFGAIVNQNTPITLTDTSDTIQKIINSKPALSIAEGIWLKFEGDAENRYSASDKYKPLFVDELNAYITCFPTGKKPTGIKSDAYLYIAVVSTDKNGRNTPVIIGRARAFGYETKNMATNSMKHIYKWMDIYSNYVQIYDIEYLNCECKDGISLLDVLAEVGAAAYPKSKGTSKSFHELGMVHYQKDKLRVTEEFKEYVDDRFERLAAQCGITRVAAI